MSCPPLFGVHYTAYSSPRMSLPGRGVSSLLDEGLGLERLGRVVEELRLDLESGRVALDRADHLGQGLRFGFEQGLAERGVPRAAVAAVVVGLSGVPPDAGIGVLQSGLAPLVRPAPVARPGQLA